MKLRKILHYNGGVYIDIFFKTKRGSLDANNVGLLQQRVIRLKKRGVLTSFLMVSHFNKLLTIND